ncbi:unnamed protein product [Phytomonas sp. Hart1]|nr:unnamed protein product [Phytomonas sp. Hart1]|eukprot:CCW70193.1 unnamed protein product [Phytomonas sp. isolate Hart1]
MPLGATLTYSLITITFLLLSTVSVFFGHAAARFGENSSSGSRGAHNLTPDKLEKLIGGERPALLIVYSSSCLNCTRLSKPLIEIADELYRNETVSEKLNIGDSDASKYPKLGERFNIAQYPSLLYFPPNKNNPSKRINSKSFNECITFIELILDYIISKNQPVPSSAPSPVPHPKVPESRPYPRVPESRPYPKVPESRPYPRVPESRPYPRVPETSPHPKVPESRPYPRVPESRPYPKVPETSPHPKVPVPTPDPGYKSMGVKNLDSTSVNELTKPGRQNPVLIMFYATWCPYSQAMLPVFDKLPEEYRDDPNIVFGKVDNDKWIQWGYMKSLGGGGVPTIFYFPKGQGNQVKYHGGPHLNILLEFLRSHNHV